MATMDPFGDWLAQREMRAELDAIFAEHAAPVVVRSKVTLNIGSVDASGLPLSAEVRANALHFALAELSRLYGGASSFEGNGAWLNGAGALVSEPNTFVFSFGENVQASDVVPIAEAIAFQLGQECVLLAIEPVTSVSFIEVPNVDNVG